MQTTKSIQEGWGQLYQQFEVGVPHAVDIVHHLSCTVLTTPLSNPMDHESDLFYYSVLHAAYRKGVLRRFLLLMERLKQHECWETLRLNKSAQQIIVDHFVVQWNCSDEECYGLLACWLTTNELGAPSLHNRLGERPSQRLAS